MRIKDIPLENRPRERMKKLGFGSLSDAEILALILQKGTRSDNVIDMSNKLIAKYGLEKLSSLSLTELSAIDGIGEAKAIQILAAFEINKRIKVSKARRIVTPQDVFDIYHPKLCNVKQEHFIVILLDTKNNIIKDEVVSIGTLDGAILHPREVFKSAIKESASSIILVHNHPSGDPSPSKQDYLITKQLVEASKLMDISIYDHIIIGQNSFERVEF